MCVTENPIVYMPHRGVNPFARVHQGFCENVSSFSRAPGRRGARAALFAGRSRGCRRGPRRQRAHRLRGGERPRAQHDLPQEHDAPAADQRVAVDHQARHPARFAQHPRRAGRDDVPRPREQQREPSEQVRRGRAGTRLQAASRENAGVKLSAGMPFPQGLGVPTQSESRCVT